MSWLVVEDEKKDTMRWLREEHKYLEGSGEILTKEEKCEIEDLEVWDLLIISAHNSTSWQWYFWLKQ